MKRAQSALAVFVACASSASSLAAGDAVTLNPGGFPYPDKLDSVTAAPGQHKLLYEDDNVRLLEVTYMPHQLGDAFHGHPYASVFAFPSVRPQVRDTALDPNSKTARGEVVGPPGALDAPRCVTMGPQAPHRPENLGDIPDHFYRIEFKHPEGPAIKTEWAARYPYMTHRRTLAEWLKESGKTPFGQAMPRPADPDAANKTTLNPKAFPYPDSYDSVTAAPGQHWLRYENAGIRFLEVMYLGHIQGDAMHGHPFASVFAFPSQRPKGNNPQLDPSKKTDSVPGGPPTGMAFPTCQVMGVQAPHRPDNQEDYPDHFYRIEFKRLDGEGFKDHWKEWYPEMARAPKGTTAGK